MRSLLPPALRLVLLAIVLGQTGCLIFSRQTIVIDYPEAGKEARVLFIYEGLRNGGDMKRSKEHLESLTLNKSLYFGDPILRLDFTAAPTPRHQEFHTILKKRCRFEAGEFWLHPDAGLCYSHSIVIADPEATVAEFNRLISAVVKEETAALLADPKKRPPEIDEETVKLAHQLSSEKSFAWLRLVPGRLSATVPASHKENARMIRGLFQAEEIEKIEKDLEKAPEDDDADKQLKKVLRRRLRNIQQVAAFVSEAPLSFDRRHDRTIISLGYGEGRPIVVPSDTLAMIEKNAGDKTSLIDFARTLPPAFREKDTTEAVIAKFLKK